MADISAKDSNDAGNAADTAYWACNVVKGTGLASYKVGSDGVSMVLTIKASQEGTYTFSFDQINPLPALSRAYVKVLSFEPA